VRQPGERVAEQRVVEEKLALRDELARDCFRIVKAMHRLHRVRPQH
jgi:hypothetical protein